MCHCIGACLEASLRGEHRGIGGRLASPKELPFRSHDGSVHEAVHHERHRLHPGTQGTKATATRFVSLIIPRGVGRRQRIAV